MYLRRDSANTAVNFKVTEQAILRRPVKFMTDGGMTAMFAVRIAGDSRLRGVSVSTLRLSPYAVRPHHGTHRSVHRHTALYLIPNFGHGRLPPNDMTVCLFCGTSM